MNKIQKNRRRDKKVQRMLRAEGWKVVRVWEHELKNDLAECIKRITSKLKADRASSKGRQRG